MLEEGAFIVSGAYGEQYYDSSHPRGTQQMTRAISWMRGSRIREFCVVLAAWISISAAASLLFFCARTHRSGSTLDESMW
jgi:hypothetical protein